MSWWPNLLFWLFGGAIVFCSVGVLVTRDIVRAAVWLLLALGSTAGVYFLLGADLIGAAQLLVYAGGTAVLLVFGVMLTARRPFLKMDTKGGDWVIGVTVGAIVFAVLSSLLVSASWPTVESPKTKMDSYELAARSPNTRRIGLYLLGIPAPEEQHMDAVNRELLQAEANKQQETTEQKRVIGYLLPFEIVSVHFLVVLIGAAYLARAERHRRRRNRQA